jgi:hypothetical protein
MCVGIEPVVLTPPLKDFNDDLRHLGADALQAACVHSSSWGMPPGSWLRRPEGRMSMGGVARIAVKAILGRYLPLTSLGRSS